MRSVGAALAGVALLLSGCVYYNGLYNAERLFEEGEVHRREGRDSLARARFDDVVRKAASGYRRDPDGAWADDALLLMGRAYLRLGRLREARPALAAARERADAEPVRLTAALSLGVADAMVGDVDGATALLNGAIRELPPGPLRAEGHLWRGVALLEAGERDAGWWDLDQAATAPGVRLDAALARVTWGIAAVNPDRVREGMTRLLRFREAGFRVDTVAALAWRAAERWDPLTAAGFLAGADTARWERTSRGMILLTRAALLRASGDSTGALAEVGRVADGFGPAAAEARLRLAGWQLAHANDLEEVRAALPLLLPAAGAPAVAARIGEIRAVLELSERGFSEPLAWFAAAEAARDGLEATAVARGLFLAYADAAPSDPWVAKALLAALAISPDEGDRAWLRGRLEGRGESPYVLAALGEPALGLEELEEELARRLQELRER